MGNLRTKKRGSSWEWSFETAKVDGKRHSMSKGGYRTKAEAVAAGTKAKAEYENAGRTFTPSKLSLGDYLDQWLEEHVKLNLAHNTYLAYENNVRIHIKPELGNYYLSSIQPDVIQKWIDRKKRAGYSINMVKSILTVLSGALNYAVMPLKYIDNNPCMYVKLQRLKEDPKLKEKREYICVKEDWEKIIERFPIDSNFYLPLQVGYHLGTRISETYGIDLSKDIDFDKKQINICHQLQKQEKQWFVKSPKYESYRVIGLDSFILDILKKEINTRKKNQIKYGKYFLKTYVSKDGSVMQLNANIQPPGGYKEIMPLSAKENGELMTPDSFKYCAKVIHQELDIPLFHSHSLRHTHGTILAENGANPKTVMERLGHKDIQTTMNRYVFNTEKMRQDAMRIWEAAINN